MAIKIGHVVKRLLISPLFPWLLLILWWLSVWAMPESYWFSTKLQVEDTIQNNVPRVSVEKWANRTFIGHWNMTVYRTNNETGLIDAVCRASGVEQQLPNAGHVEKTTLSWWFDGSTCIRELIPGDYFLEEDIGWNVMQLFYKQIIVRSNIFRVSLPFIP